MFVSFATLNVCLCLTGYPESIVSEAVLGPPWAVFAVDLHGGAL